jgi:hypothetical protein
VTNEPAKGGLGRRVLIDTKECESEGTVSPLSHITAEQSVENCT